jgi:DNA-directed RNA polymerase subunit omega
MGIEREYDSNFRFVLVAARRARQLQNGAQPLVSSHSHKASKVAQDEIASG